MCSLAEASEDLNAGNLQNTLLREEARHRDYIQNYTLALEELRQTELDFRQAQLQAVQVLKDIDVIVAQGGPPGQKDAELVEVQQQLQKSRDAMGAAKRRAEDINTAQEYRQNKENKSPDYEIIPTKPAPSLSSTTTGVGEVVKRSSAQGLPLSRQPDAQSSNQVASGAAVVYPAHRAPSQPAHLELLKLEVAAERAQRLKKEARIAELEHINSLLKHRTDQLEQEHINRTKTPSSPAKGSAPWTSTYCKLSPVEAGSGADRASLSLMAANTMKRELHHQLHTDHTGQQGRSSQHAEASIYSVLWEGSSAPNKTPPRHSLEVDSELLRHIEALTHQAEEKEAQWQQQEVAWMQADQAAKMKAAAGEQAEQASLLREAALARQVTESEARLLAEREEARRGAACVEHTHAGTLANEHQQAEALRQSLNKAQTQLEALKKAHAFSEGGYTDACNKLSAERELLRTAKKAVHVMGESKTTATIHDTAAEAAAAMTKLKLAETEAELRARTRQLGELQGEHEEVVAGHKEQQLELKRVVAAMRLEQRALHEVLAISEDALLKGQEAEKQSAGALALMEEEQGGQHALRCADQQHVQAMAASLETSQQAVSELKTLLADAEEKEQRESELRAASEQRLQAALARSQREGGEKGGEAEMELEKQKRLVEEMAAQANSNRMRLQEQLEHKQRRIDELVIDGNKTAAKQTQDAHVELVEEGERLKKQLQDARLGQQEAAMKQAALHAQLQEAEEAHKALAASAEGTARKLQAELVQREEDHQAVLFEALRQASKDALSEAGAAFNRGYEKAHQLLASVEAAKQVDIEKLQQERTKIMVQLTEAKMLAATKNQEMHELAALMVQLERHTGETLEASSEELRAATSEQRAERDARVKSDEIRAQLQHTLQEVLTASPPNSGAAMAPAHRGGAPAGYGPDSPPMRTSVTFAASSVSPPSPDPSNWVDPFPQDPFARSPFPRPLYESPGGFHFSDMTPGGGRDVSVRKRRSSLSAYNNASNTPLLSPVERAQAKQTSVTLAGQFGWPLGLARMDDSPTQGLVRQDSFEPSPLHQIRGAIRQAVKDALSNTDATQPQAEWAGAAGGVEPRKLDLEGHVQQDTFERAVQMMQAAAERELALTQQRADERVRIAEEHVTQLIQSNGLHSQWSTPSKAHSPYEPTAPAS